MTTTHAPPMSMLPFCLHLSLCLHLSPFGINGKGCPHTCVWNLWSLLIGILLPLSICTILGPVCIPRVTILSPLSSFSSLMNSRCAKVFERPYTWLALWKPSSLLWSASPNCNCSVFNIHTCFLASILWAFVPSLSLLVFLAELYVSLLISFQQFCALCPNLLHDQHLTELLELPILLWSTSFLHAWAYPWP